MHPNLPSLEGKGVDGKCEAVGVTGGKLQEQL
jgi:hypothetical protein